MIHDIAVGVLVYVTAMCALWSIAPVSVTEDEASERLGAMFVTGVAAGVLAGWLA